MKRLITVVFLAAFAFIAASPSIAQTKPDKSGYTKKEADLRASMHRLFNDHVTWQRIFAVETLAGAKDAGKARERLDKNIEDIGGAFKPFYGDETSGRISDLFKQHAQLLADYISAAQRNADTKTIVDMMAANADAAAELLSRMNPNWKRDELSNAFRGHSNDIKAEVDAQVKDFGALDVPQMDRTTDHAMAAADMLALGIMEQFPGQLK